MNNISRDENGRILILEASYDSKNFLLINLYNANSENNQLVTLDTLISLLENHNLDGSFHPIFSGDFNNIFDTVLDASGGNPSLKKKSIAKIISITEKLDTFDTFRIRHPILRRFTYRRKNPSLHRRLDYIFLSNNLQEYISSIDTIPAFMSDHSPVFMKLNFEPNVKRGKYGWKFNTSLLKDVEFTQECINIIRQTIANFDASTNPHIKWEFLKYECRKFPIDFSKRKNNLAFSLLKHHESIINKYESTTDRPSEEIYNQSKIFMITSLRHVPKIKM